PGHTDAPLDSPRSRSISGEYSYSNANRPNDAHFAPHSTPDPENELSIALRTNQLSTQPPVAEVCGSWRLPARVSRYQSWQVAPCLPITLLPITPLTIPLT